MFSERFKRARKAAGLTMAALADQVGLTAPAISKYEHGKAVPSSGNLLKLADALGVRTEYFFRPTQVSLSGVEFRKKARTPQKLLDQVRGDVLDQAERWVELLNFYPDSVKPIQPFSLPDGLPEKIATGKDIEAAAQQVREAWKLGLEPVLGMIDVFEAHGILVITTAVETGSAFDGLACTIDDAPVVVISEQQPGDRQRFTLAHELGHLVLNGRLTDGLDEEKACNHFAGAFLLPEPALYQRAGQHRTAVDMQELYMLKHEFGVSMMAVLYRLGQCGVISDNLRRRYYRQFGRNGWRTREPGDPYPNERTQLFEHLTYWALAEEFIGESKAAELLGKPLAQFHAERKLDITDESADQ